MLSRLAGTDVPPACVLDIGRLTGGGLVVLEVNTPWGAGLYGCDPTGVLRAVLAANDPADSRWLWTPDPVLLRSADDRSGRHPARGN